MVINSIVPKFLSHFEAKHKKIWQSKFNIILPKNNLNYKNENDYLGNNNLKKDDVITNSILQSLPNIEKKDLDYLVEQFSIFSLNNKIKILTIENKLIPVYIEIIETLNYITRINELLNKYPKSYGNHYGTKYRSSSYNNLLETQINILENRLDGRFFILENEDEIKKTQLQIKFIKQSLKKEFKNLPEWLNYININFGFDNKYFASTEVEIKAFTQLSSFFNGIKTSKEEILNSVMIYTKIQSKIKDEDVQVHKKLSESIINILRFFFQKTIKEIEKTKEKKTIIYNQENISKDFCIKTYIDELPIYTYVYKNTNNFLSELMEIGINSILGEKTIFDTDEEKKPISNIQIARNIINLRKELNFTRKEFELLLSFSENIQILQII